MQITRIKQNLITVQYNISFDSTNSANTITKIADEISPEVEILFSTTTRQLIIQGTDNVTLHPTVSFIEQDKEIIYQIQDEAENTTKLVFEKLKQEGNEIKAEFKSIQYNNEPVIELPKTELKYEWSVDKDTGEIKELEQRIEVKNSFDVKAKYNHQKNETKLKIKQQDQKEVEQTLPGLVIVKLTTNSGVLWFEY